jgi:hypothetical protein
MKERHLNISDFMEAAAREKLARMTTVMREAILEGGSLPAEAEIESRRGFEQAFTPHYINNEELRKLTLEEIEKEIEDDLQNRRDYLTQLYKGRLHTLDQEILLEAWSFYNRGRPITTSLPDQLESDSTILERHTESILRRPTAEQKRELPVAVRDFIANFDWETPVKDHDAQLKLHKREGLVTLPYDTVETFRKGIEERKTSLNKALPLLDHIITLFDERIAELKEAEVKAAPFQKQREEIAPKLTELVEKINPLLDSWEYEKGFNREKETQKLAERLTTLLLAYDQLERQYDEASSKIHDLRIEISPPGYAQIKKQKRERFAKWLMGGIR